MSSPACGAHPNGGRVSQQTVLQNLPIYPRGIHSVWFCFTETGGARALFAGGDLRVIQIEFDLVGPLNQNHAHRTAVPPASSMRRRTEYHTIAYEATKMTSDYASLTSSLLYGRGCRESI